MTTKPDRLADFDRSMMKSELRSLVWNVLQHRKGTEGLTRQRFAQRLGKDKSEVSRWFTSEPNWTISTIADIGRVLDLDIKVQAICRKTGEVFTPQGVQSQVKATVMLGHSGSAPNVSQQIGATVRLCG